MKKIINTVALCMACLPALAQFQWINQTALATNTVISGGLITITNTCTNSPYQTVRNTNVIVGDPLSVAFTKVNANIGVESNTFNLLSNELAGATNTLAETTNLLATTTNALAQTTNMVFGIGGLTNVMHTVTNALGVFLLTGKMYFDGGAIVSDGSGAIRLGGIVDGSGLGLHFDGSGNAAFDANVSFIGGTAEILPDTAGNGGTTLMLQASDTGTPMYQHVTGAGISTWTSSP